MKKLLSILMVAVLTLSLAVPCFATNPSLAQIRILIPNLYY